VTYENPNYRRIVERAILWVGGRLPDAAAAQSMPGEKVYGTLGCAGCHGEDARGGRGPDLRSPALWARDDAEQHVFNVIKNGVNGAGMPSFAKMASDQEINVLVRFVASSARGKGTAIAGDVNLGRVAYRANCVRCHGPAGRGGLLGPELTSVVQSKDLEYLKHAIRDPDGEIPFNYGAISVTTKDSEKLIGVRRNEDTFSLQMVDESGQLHLFEKDQLRDIVHEKKPFMPGFDESQLPQDALRSLLAYLQREGKEQ
jgi:putative heme-binding domain-containing protein